MTKDYSHLVGEKFGDREILDITYKTYNHHGWKKAYAVCKCKCGSVDDVDISALIAGRHLQCSKCSKSTRNLSTHIPNISYDRSHDDYIVTIERKGQRVVKHTRALDEAILIKELLLKHFDKHGMFEIEKLNESYYTRKSKRKTKRKPCKTKDYSYLLGQKIGKWEIVDVDSSSEEKWSQRTIQMRNRHGDIKHIKLKHALRSLKNHVNRENHVTHITRAQNSTGIENIYYRSNMNRYVVQLTRNGVTRTGSSKDLEEAIKIKERLLKEFEEENVNNG